MAKTDPAAELVVAIRPHVAARAHVDPARYIAMSEHATRDPDGFWVEQADRLQWMRRPTQIKNTRFTGDLSIRWYEDGTLNVSANCIDRHLATTRRPGRHPLGG